MHNKLMAEIALRLLLPCFVDMSCRNVQYSDRVHSIEFVSFTSLIFFLLVRETTIFYSCPANLLSAKRGVPYS